MSRHMSHNRAIAHRGVGVVVVAALATILFVATGSSPARAAGPVVSIGSVTTYEGDAAAAPIAVKVPLTLSSVQPTDVIVTWAVTGGTATPGADYKAITKPKTTKIRAGKTRGFASVSVYGDSVFDNAETVELTITSVSGAGVGASAGTVNIYDDDVLSVSAVYIGELQVVEGDEPAVGAAVKVPIRLTDPLPFDLTFGWEVAGGTATPGVDYKAVPNTKKTTIRAGKTSGTASFMVYGDTAVEGDETFFLQYAAPAGPPGISYSVQVPTVTIIDDDAAPPQASNLWAWGRGDTGALGNGTLITQSVPAVVGAGTPTTWTDASAGFAHTCAVNGDGTGWCWGDNYWGELGDGTTTNRDIPARVGFENWWVSISAGGGHTCGIRNTGELVCWGRNDEGQIGDGTTTQKTEPEPVGRDLDWASVSAGSGLHTCAIKTNGTLWCWGDNRLGTLGDGTFIDRPAPVQIGTDSDWTSVSAGAYQTCGVRGTGMLWCWGWNGFGQLGDGTTTDRNVPTQIGTAADWAHVSTGAYHTCGLRTTGGLWCWGRNFEGAVGDGTTDDRWSPTQVGTDTNWVDAAAGAGHSCGVRMDGTLWCWGWNLFGELGDATFDDRLEPVQASGLSNMLRVSASTHTVALSA